MGHRASPDLAELVVEFAHVDLDDSLGPQISWDAEFCEMPAKETIPDQERAWETEPFFRTTGLSAFRLDPMHRSNQNYHRELADYEFARRLFRPVRLMVRNAGQVAANSVRTEVTVPAKAGVVVMDSSDMPDPPKRSFDLFPGAALARIRPALRHSPGDVTIDRNDERFRIDIDCGKLQPGRRVWSDVFYIGIGTSGDVPLAGQVFAENLPQPKDFTLTIRANVTKTRLSLAQLRSLSDPSRLND